MCGGSTSGKTEFIEKFCPTENEQELEGIVFDSTLSTIEGAKVKIDKILKSNNIPIICFILPENIKRCFNAFKNRERKIPEKRFFETHSGSRDVALWIVKNYPKIEILIYSNKLVDKTLEESEFEESFFDKKTVLYQIPSLIRILCFIFLV